MKIPTLCICLILLCIKTSLLAQNKPMGFGLQMFKNIEQIVYCVPLPLSEVKELPVTERANHSFVNKKNKNITINIRGFYSVDKNIDLENYFSKSYTEQDEEAGKIITQKEVLKNKQCFYAIGYYNNFIGKFEFAEITWIRNDQVIKLEIIYPAKDKILWYNRLKVIIRNAYCQ
jgi:hypothetical protein